MLFLTSKTKSVSVPLNIIVCDSFFKRLKGALGAGRISPGEAYLFPGCSWPHTWFMRRPISILFYDIHGRIVRYLFCVAPFTFVKAVDAAGMIELDSGRFQKKQVDSFEYVRFSRQLAGRINKPHLAL